MAFLKFKTTKANLFEDTKSMADKRKKTLRSKKKLSFDKSIPIGPKGADDVILYGIHAVKAALSNPLRRIQHAFATRNAAENLREFFEKRNISVEVVEPDYISRLIAGDAVHQGIAIVANALESKDIYDVENARLVVVLDQVTDPHNVGAIIRSSVALGADAIITTHRNAPQESGLLAKTASGGLELINLVHVPNLAQALSKMNDFGYVTIGLDSAGPLDLAETFFGNKIALVLGAEGAGLRRLTRERCDVLARLDMPGPIKSLNVSNAAALSLYLAGRHLKIS